MKKLFIISGATGMTGSELLRQLTQNPENYIIGFDNFFASDVSIIADFINKPNLEFYEYDLIDSKQMNLLSDKIKKLKENYDELIYINCAAVVHTEYFYDVNSTFNINVLGMKSLLEQAISNNADSFINCSTSEVYSMESFKEGGVKETDYIYLATAEHSQRTSYATGKLMTEFFLRDAVNRKLIKGCSVRFANVYSSFELYPKHIIPHIINSLKKEKKVLLLENAKTTKRTFLHNTDSCNGVLSLLQNKDSLDGSAYNLATSEEISILELVKLIAEKMNMNDYLVEFKDNRLSDPPRRVLNIDKILSKTTWKPQISLSQGISLCLKECKR